MSLKLIFAASLIATFIAWYVCNQISGRTTRCILRASFIALLCSPGIIVGHGFAVVPSLFAIYVQPSIFSFGPMLVVFLIALGIIFGIPALRNHSSAWPPSAEEIFLKAYAPKFVLFGIVTTVLMLSLIYADQQRVILVIVLKYGFFFAGGVINLILCYWATRVKQARPLLTPLLFAAPSLLVAAPTVSFMWYGSGAIGGLIGGGHRRIAAWTSLCVFALLSINSTFRIYLATTAQPHVTIGGGMAGNAFMAIMFASLGIVAFWMLRRSHGRSKLSTTTS